jgi:hypothetical protein
MAPQYSAGCLYLILSTACGFILPLAPSTKKQYRSLENLLLVGKSSVFLGMLAAHLSHPFCGMICHPTYHNRPVDVYFNNLLHCFYV